MVGGSTEPALVNKMVAEFFGPPRAQRAEPR